MKKTYLHELIKAELNYIKEKQSFANVEEATENIATDIFTTEDWDNPNALDSLRETLNSLTVVDDDNDLVWYFGFRLYHTYCHDLKNLDEYTADDVNCESLVNDIKSIRENTIYMNEYKEYWTKF